METALDYNLNGALPSIKTGKEWVFEELTYGSRDHVNNDKDTIPPVYSLQNFGAKIRNQGNRGTCSAFAAAAITEFNIGRKFDKPEWMSPEFIYFHRKNSPKSGMYGDDAFEVLRKIGCVPESMYNYKSKDNKSNAPSQDLLEYAKKYRIKNFASVKTINGVKRAIYELGPCYLRLNLYKNRPEFWRGEKGENALGHAVLIVGYNLDGFILRNSWGDDWNGDGHIILPYEEWPHGAECWVCMDYRYDHKPRQRKHHMSKKKGKYGGVTRSDCVHIRSLSKNSLSEPVQTEEDKKELSIILPKNDQIIEKKEPKKSKNIFKKIFRSFK